MNTFRTLLTLQVRNRMAALRPDNWREADGRLKVKKIIGTALLTLLILAMAAGFIWLEIMMYHGMTALGMQETLLGLVLFAVMACMLLFSFFYVLSTLYFTRDTDFLAAMPIPSRTLLGARLTEIFIGETGFALALILPVFITHGVTLGLGAMYYVRMLLVTLTATMMPVAILTLLTTLLVSMTGVTRHREAVQMGFAMIMMVVWLTIEFRFMNSASDDVGTRNFMQMFTGQSDMLRGLTRAFPPVQWAMDGISGNVGSLLGYLACAIGSLALVWLLLGNAYIPLCLKQTESGVTVRRRKGKIRESGVHSPLAAIFLREWKEILRTPTYAFNSLSGIIMVPIMAVAMVFGYGSDSGGFTVALQMIRTAVPFFDPLYVFLIVAGVLAFACCLNPAIDTAVSREGGRHMLSRMVPVSGRTQLYGKLLMGLSLNLMAMITACAVILVLLPAIMKEVLLALVCVQVMSFACACIGLTLDTLHCNLHWRTETQAIKQNSNVMIGMLLNMLIIGIPVVVFFVTGSMTMTVRMALTAATIVAEAVLCWIGLEKIGVRAYERLEDEAA